MASEQYGFVVSLTFIVLFATLLVASPTDLQGLGETPENISPVNPSLITDFEESTNYTKSDFTGVGTLNYEYELGGEIWLCHNIASTFTLGAKIYVAGIIWLGAVSFVKFISPNGIDLGAILSLEQIAEDADNGTVRYNLQFVDTGNAGGGLVVYWNTTLYSDPADAWANDVLYFLHGMGIGASATNNIGTLLVNLLLLSLPDVPVLINILLVTPLWASIIFVLWYVIKEMIPFV